LEGKVGGSAISLVLGRSLAKGIIIVGPYILSIWTISVSRDIYSAIAKNPSYSWAIIFNVYLISALTISVTLQASTYPYFNGVFVGPNNLVNLIIILESTWPSLL
jgi:hypothetical protein